MDFGDEDEISEVDLFEVTEVRACRDLRASYMDRLEADRRTMFCQLRRALPSRIVERWYARVPRSIGRHATAVSFIVVAALALEGAPLPSLPTRRAGR